MTHSQQSRFTNDLKLANNRYIKEFAGKDGYTDEELKK